ncbi:hypothetical protein QQF64_034730 [Cirrhinus molitorella]|uniref:Uncharacterized protein n=1 Tax=Cirrhinus molitorella TaxID=172907 RepID=A0ABR3L557_9TELE
MVKAEVCSASHSTPAQPPAPVRCFCPHRHPPAALNPNNCPLSASFTAPRMWEQQITGGEEMTDGHPEDNNYHIFLTAMHDSDASPSTAQWTPTENEKREKERERYALIDA